MSAEGANVGNDESEKVRDGNPNRRKWNDAEINQEALARLTEGFKPGMSIGLQKGIKAPNLGFITPDLYFIASNLPRQFFRIVRSAPEKGLGMYIIEPGPFLLRYDEFYTLGEHHSWLP